MRRFRVLFDRVVFLYFIVGIVPLLIILSLFLRFSMDQFSEKIKEPFALQSQNYTSILNAEVDHLLHQVYAIAIDDELTSIIRQFDRNQNRYYISTLFRSQISFIRNLNSDVSDFVYINSDGDYMLSQRYHDRKAAASWENTNLRNSLVNRIIDSNSIQFMIIENIQSPTHAPNSFYLGFPISNNPQKTPTGALFISISSDFFTNLPSSLRIDDLNQGMHNLVIDEENRIVFCDDHQFNGMPLEDYLSYYNISDNLYTLTAQEINLSPWQHFSYLPHTMEYNSLIAFQKNLYIMISALSVLVFLLVTSVVVAQNIRIRRIAQDIVHFSGVERDYKIQSQSNTILQEIVVEFNAMTSRVQNLVEQLQLKERAIGESLNRQRIAEIKTLEAQINPHFLYNTLNTISWAAIEKGEIAISDMICSIAHLLQYSIRNVDLPVYVSEEVQWLNDYMFLQEKRFANLFHYTISVKDNLDDCMIYKLLLQPLIENSILHAFDGPSPHNHITVSIEPLLLSNQLQITVADNGHGMPPKTLKRIQYCLQENPDLPNSRIGLFSTCSRMQAYYGAAASINITSDAKGTKTLLTLPMLLSINKEEDL